MLLNTVTMPSTLPDLKREQTKQRSEKLTAPHKCKMILFKEVVLMYLFG